MSKAAVRIDINENMSSLRVEGAAGADVEINTGSNKELLVELVIEILKTSASIPY